MNSVYTVFSFIWKFLIKKLDLVVLFILLAGLITAHIISTQSRIKHVNLYNYYYNNKIAELSIDMDFESLHGRGKDRIEVNTLLTRYVADSVWINYGRNYYKVNDSTEYDFGIQISPLDSTYLFQNKILTEIRSNDVYSVETYLEAPIPRNKLRGYSATFRRSVNEYIVDNKQDIETVPFPTLNNKISRHEITELPTGNLLTTETVAEKKATNSILEYYMNKETTPEFLFHNTKITGEFFEPDY